MSIRINGKKYINGTVVRANPVEEVTGTLNKIGIGSDVYEIQGGGQGGGGNVYGAFIDVNRVLTTLTGQGSGDTFQTYTVTQDCIAVGTVRGDSAAIQVDNITVAYTSDSSERIGVAVPIKKGQVLSYRIDSTSTLYIYGLTFGTDNIFTPIIYSTDEREIGVWKDNKPLYQKTIMVDSITHTGEIDVSSLNIDTVVKMNGIANHPNNQWVNFPFYHNDNYYIRVYYIIDGGGDISDNCIYFEVGSRAQGLYTNGFLTLQYTKTTDVPGSGQYNTLGVPTVHYSTDEQVVGTWIDGSTLYETTFYNVTVHNTSDTLIPTPSNWNVVKLDGYLGRSPNMEHIFLPFQASSQASSIYCRLYADYNVYGGILLESNIEGAATITARYTKTAS